MNEVESEAARLMLGLALVFILFNIVAVVWFTRRIDERWGKAGYTEATALEFITWCFVLSLYGIVRKEQKRLIKIIK